MAAQLHSQLMDLTHIDVLCTTKPVLLALMRSPADYCLIIPVLSITKCSALCRWGPGKIVPQLHTRSSPLPRSHRRQDSSMTARPGDLSMKQQGQNIMLRPGTHKEGELNCFARPWLLADRLIGTRNTRGYLQITFHNQRPRLDLVTHSTCMDSQHRLRRSSLFARFTCNRAGRPPVCLQAWASVVGGLCLGSAISKARRMHLAAFLVDSISKALVGSSAHSLGTGHMTHGRIEDVLL